ncbi:GNAT family N-acetyltransferase [Amycolatopsis sp. NBC_00345]|uniref:GNAT family N-acetyltransferase n=1 Tax=Amycolatopsis sp. NBC_00345 TaxID=2975955 RepID=UPI002E25CCFD
MKISPLTQHDIPDVIELMSLGAPYIRPRTASDYWLYATLFSTTCPIAHPVRRRAGVTTALLNAVRERSQLLSARRLYLTSEPDNTAAHTTWTRRGFTNVPGDQTIEGVSVISDYKGPDKHRAVYELLI